MSAFTGEQGDEAIQTATKHGLIDGFVCKPFQMKYLESRIEDSIAKHEMVHKLMSIERDKQQLIQKHKDLEKKQDILTSLNERRLEKEVQAKIVQNDKNSSKMKPKKAA
jgi:response regulator of citrate/malate metabolism